MDAFWGAVDTLVVGMQELAPIMEKTYFKTTAIDPMIDEYAKAIGFEPTLLPRPTGSSAT